MKVLICGDRNWTDIKLIRKRLCKLPVGSMLIHGAAPGADSLAAIIGDSLGFAVLAFSAEWEKLGKAAGPIRNKTMLAELPDLVIAFHDDMTKSKGTKDCISQATKKGIKVEIIGHDGTSIINGGLFS